MGKKEKSQKRSRTCREDALKQKEPESQVVMQQLLLNVFRNSFPTDTVDVHAVIQQVKQHLYNRDFAAAFGKDAHLHAYAFRWSPSRALAYLDILRSFPVIETVLFGDRPSQTNSSSACLDVARQQNKKNTASRKVVAIGGGSGAEMVAFAGLLNIFLQEQTSENAYQMQFHVVDIADWSSVLGSLQECITKPPPLSKYSSERVKAANVALLQPTQMTVSFTQQDILSADSTRGLDVLLEDVSMITIMFTLNELYASSIGATTRFLLDVTLLTQPGTLLLVVDSPGSYSTVSISNNAEKKYPMQWLLDHTLLDSGSKEWEKLVTEESRWFRRSTSLKYPIDLEDMRYQVHLYRRL